MRFALVLSLAALAPLAVPGAVLAQAAPSASATAAPGGYNVEETELGTLLDDPAAKAVLQKQIPDIVNSDQIDMARGMTLKALQQYASDKLTDAKLAQIQTELAKVPAPK